MFFFQLGHWHWVYRLDDEDEDDAAAVADVRASSSSVVLLIDSYCRLLHILSVRLSVLAVPARKEKKREKKRRPTGNVISDSNLLYCASRARTHATRAVMLLLLLLLSRVCVCWMLRELVSWCLFSRVAKGRKWKPILIEPSNHAAAANTKKESPLSSSLSLFYDAVSHLITMARLNIRVGFSRLLFPSLPSPRALFEGFPFDSFVLLLLLLSLSLPTRVIIE